MLLLPAAGWDCKGLDSMKWDAMSEADSTCIPAILGDENCNYIMVYIYYHKLCNESDKEYNLLNEHIHAVVV